MGTIFEDIAFEQFVEWSKENRKTFERIHKLIKDIRRNGSMQGIGKPERLKYRPVFSRRIDEENRLVYDIDEDGNLHILACKGHYED